MSLLNRMELLRGNQFLLGYHQLYNALGDFVMSRKTTMKQMKVRTRTMTPGWQGGWDYFIVPREEKRFGRDKYQVRCANEWVYGPWRARSVVSAHLSHASNMRWCLGEHEATAKAGRMVHWKSRCLQAASSEMAISDCPRPQRVDINPTMYQTTKLNCVALTAANDITRCDPITAELVSHC
jgi:hypothetical protein